MPELSDRDRDRFRRLRERLADVGRADRPTRDRPLDAGPIEPMLSTPFEGDLGALDEAAWLAERKYDGTRLILERLDGALSAYTRRGIDRIGAIPAVADEAQSAVPDGCVIDGEYVYLAPDDTSRFRPIHSTKPLDDLTPVLYCFDVLAHGGKWVIDRSLTERKAILLDALEPGVHLRTVPGRDAGFVAFFDELVERGEEGIMVKRRRSRYHPGVRSDHWRKVKAFEVADLLAVGYTAGSGARAATFGALVLSDGDRFVGKVGSGFSEDELAAVAELFVEADERSFAFRTVGDPYTPIEPIVVQVRYQELTGGGRVRAPVFVKAKPDKPVDEVDSMAP